MVGAYDSAAWSAAWSDDPAVRRYIAIWLPFLEAYEAGLWIYWILEREVIAVARPVMRILDDRLHAEDGPAVWWPNGTRYYFWRGVQVPERVIMDPKSLHLHELLGEANAEVRRAMIERYGVRQFLVNTKAAKVSADDYGILWHVDMFALDVPGAGEREPTMAWVQVVNSSPEPDGTFKDYFLRVPPSGRRSGRRRPEQCTEWACATRIDAPVTAHAAVAWTFRRCPDHYLPAVQT